MKRIYMLLLLLTTLTLVSCNTEKYDVVVSIYPYYDVVKTITNDEVSVKLLAPIGSDIHNYEPSGKDMIAIKTAKIFIYTDHHDAWVTRAKIGDDTLRINFETGYSGHHKWTNPLLMIDLIEQALPKLIEINPESETLYRNNANKYINDIKAADIELRDLLSGREIYYAGHNAFDTIEELYGFNIISFDDNMEHGELDPKVLTTFVEEIIEKNVKVLFYEELSEINEANTIKDLVLETNSSFKLELKLLHGYHNVSKQEFIDRVSYLDLIKQNVENLKAALTWTIY